MGDGSNHTPGILTAALARPSPCLQQGRVPSHPAIPAPHQCQPSALCKLRPLSGAPSILGSEQKGVLCSVPSLLPSLDVSIRHCPGRQAAARGQAPGGPLVPPLVLFCCETVLTDVGHPPAPEVYGRRGYCANQNGNASLGK